MDLADRISRGAVAALDLAPLDPRFAELSRQVLQGGASRFATLVDPNEEVDYVVPVGVPRASVNFGALVVQASRVGVIWRDHRAGDTQAVVALGPETRASWSPITLGGEQWARFDLDDGHSQLAFLAPPTGTPLLFGTLARLLAAGPAGDVDATQTMPPVAAPPAPVPPAEPEPGRQPEVGADHSPEPVELPPVPEGPQPATAPAPRPLASPESAWATDAPLAELLDAATVPMDRGLPAPASRIPASPVSHPSPPAPLFRDGPRVSAPAPGPARDPWATATTPPSPVLPYPTATPAAAGPPQRP